MFFWCSHIYPSWYLTLLLQTETESSRHTRGSEDCQHVMSFFSRSSSDPVIIVSPLIEAVIGKVQFKQACRLWKLQQAVHQHYVSAHRNECFGKGKVRIFSNSPDLQCIANQSDFSIKHPLSFVKQVFNILIRTVFVKTELSAGLLLYHCTDGCKQYKTGSGALCLVIVTSQTIDIKIYGIDANLNRVGSYVWENKNSKKILK